MFTIRAPETIEATLTITGQGRSQQLELAFKHRTASDYRELLERIDKEGGLTAADAVFESLAKWNADAELTRENVQLLGEHQPGVLWAIMTAYGEALLVARKGN